MESETVLSSNHYTVVTGASIAADLDDSSSVMSYSSGVRAHSFDKSQVYGKYC